MRPGTPHERHASARAFEQLDRLHRHQAQGEVAPADREVASVGGDRLDAQSRRAPAQLLEQDGVEIERRHRVAGSRELERHPTGTRADIEDRPFRALRELQPERQIGTIGTALELVPEDSRRRARGGRPSGRIVPRGVHDHELLASPRAISSSRSESIAV